MNRSTTLIRVEQLLDLFHDGFHKLFGSPERRFKKGLRKAKRQARLNTKEAVRKKRLKTLAQEQDNRLVFEKYLKQRKQISDQIIQERMDGLEKDQQTLSHDNDIEL